MLQWIYDANTRKNVGGEAIKEMQALTGCKVNILPPSGPDGDREVTLQGSRTAIDQATQSIMEKVDALVCWNIYELITDFFCGSSD